MKPTRDDLARNLMRARWMLRQSNASEDSLWLTFIDNALSQYYGPEQFAAYLGSTPDRIEYDYAHGEARVYAPAEAGMHDER